MSAADSNNNKELPSADICANCGKCEEGSNSLKACTACKMVKYCNRECQIAHRPQHKRECKKRAAELHDENLFKQPPPEHGDCPICFIRIPALFSGWGYQECCGKIICSGCIHAPVYDNQGNLLDNDKQNECPFCRAIRPTSNEELMQRIKKRVKAGDAEAICIMARYYRDGTYGLPQDMDKALELWHRAADAGIAKAYGNIGNSYHLGIGVEVDKEKAKHYYELAAMGGNVDARSNLGALEAHKGNGDSALRHGMIAVKGGDSGPLVPIRNMFECGDATKEDYTKALQLYQTYLGEIKSPQRDKAAAFSDQFKYY